MVNPLKHANNLNEKDLKYIYEKLNSEFEAAADYNTKKELNQKIIIFILSCQRFSPQDIIRLPYRYFKRLDESEILYEPIRRHLNNNYCNYNGLLLTDNCNEAYTVEGIDQLLSTIDTGNGKTVSVETLNKTSSRFNDYGKKKINKRDIKGFLNLIKNESLENSVILHKGDIDDIMKVESQDNMVLERINKLSDELKEEISNSQKTENSTTSDELHNIMEKQEILEASLTNKYNQLASTVNKIHQKIKSSNNRVTQLNDSIQELSNISLQNKSTTKSNQEDRLRELDEKMNEILDKINPKEVEDTVKTQDTVKDVTVRDDSITKDEYKEFMCKWFNRNLRITKNPHDTVDMQSITRKLAKHLEDKNIHIDNQYLFNRLESYMRYWYNQHDTVMSFKDIKSESISNKEFYGYIKFVDIRQERENRIKNSIVAWLKEHTEKSKGSKTYTQDIFRKIQPLFEENGWIITSDEEFKELQKTGYKKICPNRTFSQIIGKSMQEVYDSIDIQRDSPVNTGFVTWYRDIEIIDRKISDSVHSRIRDELRNEIFESGNIIFDYLEENIEVTGNVDDKISVSDLQSLVLEYLNKEKIKIPRILALHAYQNSLDEFIHQYNLSVSEGELTGMVLKNDDYVRSLMSNWIDTHVMHSDNEHERLYVEDISDKILARLGEDNISVVTGDIYSKIPVSLKDSFISKEKYHKLLSDVLDNGIQNELTEDDASGSYYRQLEIVKYVPLNVDDLSRWIGENIEDILKSNVASKNVMIERIQEYMSAHNIINDTGHSLEELVNREVEQYYVDKNVTLKLLSDNTDEYYVLINA